MHYYVQYLEHYSFIVYFIYGNGWESKIKVWKYTVSEPECTIG